MTFLLLPEDESGFRAFNVNCNRSGITTYNRALLCSSNSVTRWPDCVFNIWPFPTLKFAQKHTKSANASKKLCLKPIKPTIYCQRFLHICQSGGISPNLVTLSSKWISRFWTNKRSCNWILLKAIVQIKKFLFILNFEQKGLGECYHIVGLESTHVHLYEGLRFEFKPSIDIKKMIVQKFVHSGRVKLACINLGSNPVLGVAE